LTKHILKKSDIKVGRRRIFPKLIDFARCLGERLDDMKNGKSSVSKAAGDRVELGQYIVADPKICHGKPTFKGTRIMVWQILDELAHGMTPEDIVKAWDGKVVREAIAESVQIARVSLLDSGGRLRHPEELAAA
jgi:uncharacterized protein (DUF433 family)